MTRDEFLGRLGELLACLPAEQVEETKAFYAEAIADRMEDGMSEEEAVAAMGAPGEVAEATLDDLPAVPRAIARTRRRSTALLWVLTIVGSPVWVPLLAAFAAVAVTVYICIWVLALCVWIVAAALGGVGVVELLLAVSGVTIGPSRTPSPRRAWGSASSAWRSSLVLALGPPQNKLCASRRSGRGRPPRPSGRVRARRAALPRISRRRKE
jgi:uncharacterized membrane protein